MQAQSSLLLLATVAIAIARSKNPSRAASLQVVTPIQIKGDAAGLQTHVSINLGAGDMAGRAFIAQQQTAVDAQNMNILELTPDLRIVALPKTAKVIMGAAGQVVILEDLVTGSFGQPSGLQTRPSQFPIQIFGAGGHGAAATIDATTSTSKALLTLPMESNKMGISKANVLDNLVTGANEQCAAPLRPKSKSLKLLPAFAGEVEAGQKQLQSRPRISSAEVTPISTRSSAKPTPRTEAARRDTKIGTIKAAKGEQTKCGSKICYMGKGKQANGKQGKSKKATAAKVWKPTAKRAVEPSQAQKMARQTISSGRHTTTTTLVHVIPSDAGVARPKVTSIPGRNFNDRGSRSQPNGRLVSSRIAGVATTIKTAIVSSSVDPAAGSAATLSGKGADSNYGRHKADTSRVDMKGSSTRCAPGLYMLISGVAAGILFL